MFAGIGYLMTGGFDLVGIDLDRCVTPDGQVAPWAQEIVDTVGSYAEVSPSGNGLRVFAGGAAVCDWTNHERGIEVYAGHTPRFLTVTGQRAAGGAAQVSLAPAQALAELQARYARERETATATVIALAMPDLVDELLMPDLAALDLPYRTRDLLAEGLTGADRSRDLFAAAIDLFNAGLDRAQVLTALAENPHTMGIALDHRRQDHDRALMYLWVEHTQKAEGRAGGRVATADDFEDVRGAAAPAEVAKRPRFAFDQAAAFTQRQPLEWLIKRVLPRADVGVVFGESGAGKSFLTLDLCMAVAQGLDWRGHRVKQGAVAYVVAEGASGFRLRLQAFAEHHAVDLAGLPLWVLGDAPNLLEKADVRDLVAALQAIPALSLVVLDTLAQATPGANENSAEDMGRALAHCRTVRQSTGAMVLLVAHAGKDASRGLRGWSGIKGALDVEILVERAEQWRAATITKMKDGTGEGTEYGFELVSVHLGEDEDGEAITSCVVGAAGGAGRGGRARPQPKGAVQKLVLRVAQGLVDLAEDVPHTALIDAAVNEMPAPEAGKRDKRREHVMRAVESLVAVNVLSVAGGRLSLPNSAD